MPRPQPRPGSWIPSVQVVRFPTPLTATLAEVLGIEDDPEAVAYLGRAMSKVSTEYLGNLAFDRMPTDGQVKATLAKLSEALRRAVRLTEDLDARSTKAIWRAYSGLPFPFEDPETFGTHRMAADETGLRRLRRAVGAAAEHIDTVYSRKKGTRSPRRVALMMLARTYEELTGKKPTATKNRNHDGRQGPFVRFVRAATAEEPLRIDWHSDEAMGKEMDRALEDYRAVRGEYPPRFVTEDFYQ